MSHFFLKNDTDMANILVQSVIRLWLTVAQTLLRSWQKQMLLKLKYAFGLKKRKAS